MILPTVLLLTIILFVRSHELIVNINHESNTINNESCLAYEGEYCLLPISNYFVSFETGYFTYYAKDQKTQAKLVYSFENITVNMYIDTFNNPVFTQDSVFYKLIKVSSPLDESQNRSEIPKGAEGYIYYTCSMNNGCCWGNPCTTNRTVTYQWNTYNKTLSIFGPASLIGSNLIITYSYYDNFNGGIEYFLYGAFNNEMFNIAIM